MTTRLQSHRLVVAMGLFLSLGTACGKAHVNEPLSIQPGTATVAPRGSQAFTARGGNGPGYVFSLETNASGGHVDAATGAYVAGSVGGVTDVVKVVDTAGAFQSATVTVTAGVAISPASAAVPPRGSQTFSASGGSGTGFTWSLATNASGGTIGASTGLYTAGATGSVTDVVLVTDALGNTATREVVVGAAIVIAPATAGLPPRGSQAFTASGGSGTGFTWSLATNASGGSIGASTGLYTAGATGSVTDVVQVTDALGNTATRDVVVSTAIVVNPGAVGLPPRASQAFTASGGSGTGFTWSLATNASGGTIGASTGAYTAGATQGNDVVRVTDSLGNSTTVEVTVTSGLSITVSSTTTPPRGHLTFGGAGGSGTGFTWSLATNASGGTIGASTGAYTAGPTPGVSDVVQLADSLGNTATRTVTVTAGVSIAPATAAAPPRGSLSFTASGGSGTGFTWSLVTNGSGGTVGASTGTYVAGATGGVTDVLQVADSLGNTATRSVAVGAGVSIAPATVTLTPRGSTTFVASGGSGTGFAWSITTNASGGTISASTGAYTAGPTGSVTDVVRVVDSLGNVASRNVAVSAGVAVTPATASTPPRGTLALGATGGTGVYTFAITTNASGGTISSSTGAYTAGPTGSVTDVVTVTDSLGNVGTRNVAVGPGITVAPAAASLAPRGAQTFMASGGSGAGYTWALATNNSGATLSSAGAYLAGSVPSVVDVVRVTDVLGNTATVNVTVGPGVSIAPTSASLAPRASRTFTASGGSGSPYTWALATNASGGSVSAAGVYTAGSTGSVTDLVRATDALGNTATVSVTVGAGVSLTPASASVAPRGSQTFAASGGGGSPYTWTLPTNGSGGNVTAGGVYTAGSTGSATDVVRATDALGNVASATVTVTAGVSITPLTVTLDPGETQTLSASGGSGSPYTWTLSTNASGGSVSAAGLYTAGTAGGVTDVVQATDSLGNAATRSVTVRAMVLQRWQTPTAWGGTASSFWTDDGHMVQHATFDAAGLPIETGSAGLGWSKGGSGTIQHSDFTGFAYPQVTRHGAGPFPATDDFATFDATRYESTGDGAPLDLPGDMLACAVFRPDYNPVDDGYERIILAKGTQGVDGWVLMQMHQSFCFHYQGATSGEGMAFTNSEVPDMGRGVGPGPNEISYVVMCGGRSGDSTVVAVNNYPASVVTGALVPGEPLHLASGVPATIGGYADGRGSHRFGGTVYETAVWNVPATQANIEARMAAVLGLAQPDGTAARYARYHEGPFVGVDGKYHTGWRHSPRIDPAKGFQFGGFGQNGVAAITVDGGVHPSALGLWTATAGSDVVANTVMQPGDGLANSADRVHLAAGGSISTTLDLFSALPVGLTAGPLQGQIWLYLDTASGDSTAGTLRVRTTVPPAVDMGHFDIDLSSLTPNAWNRVFISSGLTTDGSQTAPGTLLLENDGATPLQFTAWGVDVGQFGGLRGLPSGFDPGLGMFDSLLRSNRAEALTLPAAPASNGADGLCISATAQPYATLGWSTNFDDDRALAHWWNGLAGAQERSLRLIIGGDPSITIVQGDLTSRAIVDGVTIFAHGTPPAGWTAGSLHNVKSCLSAAGVLQIYADDVPVGSPVSFPGGTPVPDAATGHLAIGNDFDSSMPWYGWISQALVCRFNGDPAVCR